MKSRLQLFVLFMKNFRSSKNLRAIDPSAKEESALRIKVRTLEEQIELLQKSNLNIFIPLSEHESKNTPNYVAIINKLKTQVLSLQQEVQRQKGFIKKIENEKEIIRITHSNEIQKLEQRIADLLNERTGLNEEIQSLDSLLDKQKVTRSEVERSLIELRVENKFLGDDLTFEKRRLKAVQQKYDQLHSQVLGVKFHSRIYNSRSITITAIETQELAKLKAYIEQLEKKIKELLEKGKQEKVTLGIHKKDIGEEIVRLKKNIDLQLGLSSNEDSTKSFLAVYQQATGSIDTLIRSCKS